MTKNVKYIHPRPVMTDNMYGTGEWTSGEVKEVPDNIAAKLARHCDCWEITKEKATQTVEVAKKDTSEDDDLDQTEQDLRLMDKEHLLDYAAREFPAMNFDKRKSVDNLREDVITHIRRFRT